MILIRGGRVVDPATGRDERADLILEGGVIREICAPGQAAETDFDQVIDAQNLVAAPGLVDVHVHFRDPGLTYKEDIHSGARAAARGGFTTVVCMANTKPIVDNEETLRYVLAEGKKTGIHVLSCAAVSRGFEGRELTDMEGLLAAGAAGFTDDGIPLMDGVFVKKAMEEAARLDTVLSFHEEDKSFIVNNGINHGAVSDRLGIYGSPALAEDALVARDCMIALETGAKVDIQHISSGHAVRMVRIATDHAPHSAEEKARPLTEAPSGIIGLETALALGITCLVKPGHLSLCELMKKMSFNPARLYKLDCGRLEAGAPADLVLFDENEEWTVTDFASRAANSPFVGERLTGRVKYTICEGKVVYQDR